MCTSSSRSWWAWPHGGSGPSRFDRLEICWQGWHQQSDHTLMGILKEVMKHCIYTSLNITSHDKFFHCCHLPRRYQSVCCEAWCTLRLLVSIMGRQAQNFSCKSNSIRVPKEHKSSLTLLFDKEVCCSYGEDSICQTMLCFVGIF